LGVAESEATYPLLAEVLLNKFMLILPIS